MKTITITKTLSAKCPALALGCLSMTVAVAPAGEALRAEIASTIQGLISRFRVEDIHGISAVGATREAYRACGKEPSRYRPSAEALLRRVLSGKGLYEINNVVDLLNCISIRTGYSIGGFDADLIEGEVALGIGAEGEPYEAIARGPLNIEFLPVLRDAAGAFGTPTSDSTRTGVTANTSDFLMVFYDFAGSADLEAVLRVAARQYELYCGAAVKEVEVVRVG